MIDFPASPINGQTFGAPNGVTYVYQSPPGIWTVQTTPTTGSGSTIALQNSPIFTGDPQAPTPLTADNDTSIATTAYVKANLAGYAPLASPVFTGNPTGPTPSPGDNDTSLATTAFVAAAIATAGGAYLPLAGGTLTGPLVVNGAIASPAGGTLSNGVNFGTHVNFGINFGSGVPNKAMASGSIYIADGDNPSVNVDGSALGWKYIALIDSPTFTGDPRAPTPVTADNDTSIATTAFVKAQGYALSSSIPTTLPPSGAATGDLAGTYPAPTIKASVGLTGTPTAPTPLTADSSTSIATTAFVKAQGYLTAAAAGGLYAPLSHTHPESDITGLVADLATKAPLASPTFTGDPKAPTPSPGDNDTSIATTAFVTAALAAGATIAAGDTPPASPTTNMLWWSSALGTLFIWYNDGNTTQWVPATPAGVPLASGPPAFYASLTADVPLTNTGQFFSSATAVIGPLGSAGEKWRVQAGATFSNTGGSSDYCVGAIFNGTTQIMADTVLTGPNGGNAHVTVGAIVTLAGAMTFTLQGKDNSTVNGHMVGGYITAQRVS